MTGVRFRRPTESDHGRLIGQLDEWWGGRRVRQSLPRLWFQHVTGTSWLAEDEDGRPVGFLVGFISQDRPDEAYIHMAGTSPNRRRSGIGRSLYDRFLDDVRGRGVARVTAITWPGNRTSVAFHRALGFSISEGPGTQNLYGTPAYPDYDGDGEDRVVFSREL
jgi:ribosomal protein S18 acetylase RimI-like enzyme